jgi:hypothetical protein
MFIYLSYLFLTTDQGVKSSINSKIIGQQRSGLKSGNLTLEPISLSHLAHPSLMWAQTWVIIEKNRLDLLVNSIAAWLV